MYSVDLVAMESLLSLSLFLGMVMVPVSPGEGVVYCVIPTESSSCRNHTCQKCETLQYYINSVNNTINRQDNVTLVFMPGTHIATTYGDNDFTVSAAAVKVVGSSHNVTVTVTSQHEDSGPGGRVVFSHPVSTLHIENIIFKSTTVAVLNPNVADIPDGVKHPSCQNSSSHTVSCYFRTVVIENCAFKKSVLEIDCSTELLLQDCTLSSKSSLNISRVPKAILQDFYVYDTSCSVTGSDATITGKSELSTKALNTNKAFYRSVVEELRSFFVSYSNITLSGNVQFKNSIAIYGGALYLHFTTLNIATDADVVFINNRALAQGGAIYFSSSAVYIADSGANVAFVKNSAHDKGGAIYIHPGRIVSSMVTDDGDRCFYTESDRESAHDGHNNMSYVYFANNFAPNGGNNIYGASMYKCLHTHSNSSLSDKIASDVSSDPLRVCVCDGNGLPRCNTTDYHSVISDPEIYPGQSFSIPVVLVGVEYGTTTGVVYSSYLQADNLGFNSTERNRYAINNPHQCTDLSYPLYSSKPPENVTVYISAVYLDAQTLFKLQYHDGGAELCPPDLKYCYSIIPIFLKVTILPCPPGFTLSNKVCECLLLDTLFDNCTIINETGYFSWNSNAWASLQLEGDKLLFNTHCPFNYCKISRKLTDFNISDCPRDYCKLAGKTTFNFIDLMNNSGYQCAFNRNGTLCGGCKENYSLAIGSSHCISCPTNNNLALMLFFAAAGFLLVFFITTLNLTVSQGTINGLIFYANIVWVYKGVFFSPYYREKLSFLKVFIAWVNLDFGIETCFVSGLTALSKTLLQFIFPFYIWTIAVLIIVASRYSSRVTNLLGNRAVPVLDTLFLLSYMKLLRIVVTALEFSFISYISQNSTGLHSVVWSVDGNLSYFSFPHILLFFAGIATLILLCAPYTMLLLLIQWLRRLSHFKFINWIMRLYPAYDAYFAPLKYKHQYWFGVLLLARVILLMAFVSTFATPQFVNLLLLLAVGVLLIFYITVVQPYKSTLIVTLQSAYLANLILLAGFVIVSSISNRPTLQTAAVGLSTGIAFLQFCGTVLYAVIVIAKSKCQQVGCCCGDSQENYSDDLDDYYDRHSTGTLTINNNNESKPLLNVPCNNSVPTY